MQRGLDHPAPDFLTCCAQRFNVFHIQRGQAFVNPLMQVVVSDKRLERIGGGRVAAGNRDPETGQLADHFAE